MLMRIEKNRLSLLAISLILMGGTCLAAPDIYRWVDAEGVVHFSEMPAANGKSELVDTRVTIARTPQPVTDPEEEPASQPATAAERVSPAQQIREQRAIAQQEAAAQKAQLEENCK